MSLKTQLDLDVDNVFLNVDEFAENVIYVNSAGVQTSGKAIVNVDGDSSNDWAGGDVLLAEIIMSKSFCGGIKPHEKILDSENRTWIVVSIKDLDCSAISVSAHSDFRIKS